MSEIDKAYDPKKRNFKETFDFWESNDFFKPNPEAPNGPYCIVIPPPNVTGKLHAGHALNNTLQDVCIRWRRMRGFETLWVPGTDHAGISTQTVVEQHLMATEGKSRKDYSREDFLDIVWQWKREKEGTILGQLKQMGCSCDWSRLRFTMDEGNNKAVRKAFKTMFDQGLIYQGDYLVNWDPVTQTALADDELEHEDRQSFLWHFSYPLKNGEGSVTIATTRPETMLGDTGVAVSPSDPRYSALIGETVILPITGREIPIVADHRVDPAFGTGAVKITPAHDNTDYLIGQDHHLPLLNIMTPDGKINEEGGEFAGMSMMDARQAVVAKMKELGHLEKQDPHNLRVAIGYRSKAVIEPYLSKQWFVRLSKFSKPLGDMVADGEVRIIPEHWKNTYFHWIENLRDWCISRQLWWGHRIPIWYKKDDPSQMICYEGLGDPPEVQEDPDAWYQDEDVLDTWFSSGLWPFATLGWPDKTPDLEKFYPNNVLITGHDILFFWIARMLLMGQFFNETPPFPVTYLNGLVFGKSYWRIDPERGVRYVQGDEQKRYDLGETPPPDVKSKWEKMSKSKGNVIDPLEIIEEYGPDAMRMALCASASLGSQIDLDRRRFGDFKNFTNKVWNGARFVFKNLFENPKSSLSCADMAEGLNPELLALEDKWILGKLHEVTQGINKELENFEFDKAALHAYDFFWKEFCSYYLEMTKPVLFGKAGSPEERHNKQKILGIVLCAAIRLLHPMAPFISEELFQSFKEQMGEIPEEIPEDDLCREALEALKAPACIVAPYPDFAKSAGAFDPKVMDDFSLMEKLLYTVRNIRGEMKVGPGTATDVYLLGSEDDGDFRVLCENIHILPALVRTKDVHLLTEAPKLSFSSTGTVNRVKVLIPLPEELQEKEKERLAKEKLKLEENLVRLSQQLSNPSFVSRAPAHLVEEKKEHQSLVQEELEEVSRKIALLAGD